MLTRVVVDNGVVVTYGGPNLVQVAIPDVHRKMCGLCKNITADMKNGKQSLNGSFANEVPIFASSWSLSPPTISCSDECDFCPVCNSSMTAEFASDLFCGMLLAPAGSFSGCHSTVDPKPFFQNCVSDLCKTNGNKELFCSSLTEYSFACQDAGAVIKPWRGEKCCEYNRSRLLHVHVVFSLVCYDVLVHVTKNKSAHMLLWNMLMCYTLSLIAVRIAQLCSLHTNYFSPSHSALMP